MTCLALDDRAAGGAARCPALARVEGDFALLDDLSDAAPRAGALAFEGALDRAELVDRAGVLLRVELVDREAVFDRAEVVDFDGDLALLVVDFFAVVFALDGLFFVLLFALLFLVFTAIDLAPFNARQVVHAQPARRDGSVLE